MKYLTAALLAGALALPASAPAQGIDEFPLPAGSAPTFITAGHDGRLWFAKHGFAEIGRIGTNGVLQPSVASQPNPIDVAAGPDGAMYWTNNTHVHMRAAAGFVRERALDTESGYAVAPSATRVWWTQIDPIHGGFSAVYNTSLDLQAPQSGAVFEPATAGVPRFTDITMAPDGRFWLPLHEASVIFVVRDTGGGSPERVLRHDLAPGSLPYRITPGPDGAMWFTEQGANMIGRITNTGAVTEFPLPRPNSGPYDIVAGPDGALWFTEFSPAGNAIGRITTDGKVTEYAVPTAASNPWGIAVGPDGKIWFAESATHKIGRLDPATAVPIGGGGGPGGGPGADRTKPAFQGRVTISRKRFSVGRAATPFTIAQAVRSGTQFRFNLSEPARVTVKIERKARGRRVRGRCRAKASKGRRCTLWKSAGRSLVRQGLQGPNSIAFSGRLGRKALAVGSYRALIVGTDAAGNRSRTAKLGFAIVRKRR